MANIISNKMLTNLGEGAIDLENDIIKVALMTSSYTPDKDIDVFDNTNEVSGVNYIAGGATLANSVITQDNSNDQAVWNADDVEWDTSTITARYAIIYDTFISNLILLVIDFETDQVSSNAMFAIRWNSDGIFSSNQG